MIRYIFSQVASSLSYILCAFFIKHNLIKSNTMVIMLHVDILIPLLFFIYYKFFTSKKEKQSAKIGKIFNTTKKRIQFLLFIPAMSTAFLKAFLFDKLGAINSSFSDLVVPIIVSIGCVFIFKERFKKEHFKIMIYSFIGFLISIYSSISLENFRLLMFYIIFKSISELIVRSYCKNRDSDLQAVLAENLIFSFFGILLLLVFYKIDYTLLLNPYLFVIAIVCHVQHVLQAKGVRNSVKMAMLECSKFLKVGITCLISYVLLDSTISVNNILGFIIIVFVFVKYKKYLK